MSNTNTFLPGNKFFRRPDLSPSTRFHIAFTALSAKMAGKWGQITELSRQFMISRMFVYMLANTLQDASLDIFGENASPSARNRNLPYRYVLSLRLEGRCSIEAISAIMKRFGLQNGSVGSISQLLQRIGAILPNTLATGKDEIRLVVFLSDEVFAKNVPILVTVDPIRSAILRIELADSRKVEDWKNHWECIQKSGHIATYLVTDEGKGLCGAHQKALADIIRQPDTYHAISHCLGKWAKILEQAALKAIEKEYECWNKLDSARSEAVINSRIDAYEKAEKKADETIEIYDAFSFLYVSIIRELDLFDSNGNLRDRKRAEENIEAGLSLLKELGHTRITKAAQKVRRTMPDLLNFFDKAETVVAGLSEILIDPYALKAFCLAWQWRKALIKSKKTNGRKACRQNEKFCLQIAEAYLQEESEFVKEQVYAQLDQIVQSSALVECIHSIIRPYLDGSRNHVNQEALNLIMFYHNHRRYRAGKRKGQTPMEILTGKKEEMDWIDLLFEVVREKDKSFFLSFE